MKFSNILASVVQRFGLGLDTSRCSCSQSPRVFCSSGSRSSVGDAHVTGLQRSKVMPPAGAWAWSLIFMTRTGVFCRARTGVLAMCNLFFLCVCEIVSSGSAKPFAASSGFCRCAVTTHTCGWNGLVAGQSEPR